jgi:hypothetical protein
MTKFHIEPEMAALLDDMSDEEMRVFAEFQEGPESDEQIELFLYACFLIFTRTTSIEYLERAIQQAEGWVAATPNDHPQRVRRTEILDTMSARLCERRQMLEDLSRGRSVTFPVALIPA